MAINVSEINAALDQIEVLECVHERINAGTIFHHIDQTFERT